MNSILVYVHKADESDYLIRYAAALGKEMNMSIELMYTVELQNYPMGIPGAARPAFQYTHEQVESLFEEVRSKFDQEIEKIKAEMDNPPNIKYNTQEGISHHVLKEHAAGKKYKYLLVAAHSENEFMINDRNIDIIKQVNLPVWIVPENKKYNPLKSIIYATDYNKEDIETMKMLVSLARITEAKITALHVNDDLNFEEEVKNSGFKDLLAEKVGYENIDVSTLVQEKNKSLPETINDFAKLINADLIVALKENKGFFERLFSKSATKKIITTSELPVLVFQED